MWTQPELMSKQLKHCVVAVRQIMSAPILAANLLTLHLSPCPLLRDEVRTVCGVVYPRHLGRQRGWPCGIGFGAVGVAFYRGGLVERLIGGLHLHGQMWRGGHGSNGY